MATTIMEAISEGLGLEKGYIEESMGVGIQILAANYYPPCPEPEKTLGLAAHSDHGALTILTQNGVDGLQIKHDQAWFAVQHQPSSFLVNIGDYLEVGIPFPTSIGVGTRPGPKLFRASNIMAQPGPD